jgi:hypothetical protein
LKREYVPILKASYRLYLYDTEIQTLRAKGEWYDRGGTDRLAMRQRLLSRRNAAKRDLVKAVERMEEADKGLLKGLLGKRIPTEVNI